MFCKDLYNVLGILLLLFGWPHQGHGHDYSVTLRTGNARRHNGICTDHNPGEFVGNPDDCKLFYLCTDNDEAVVASCPHTMLFNPVSKLCDVAENVNCRVAADPPTAPTSGGDGDTSNVANATNNTSGELDEATRYCASLPSRQDASRVTYIGSQLNCQHYYICYYGQALRQECSANLHWNADIATCDLAENANCVLGGINSNPINTVENPAAGGSSAISNGANSDTNQSELIDCPVYGQHIFPHMGRCDFFIYCVKGHAILQKCPFYFHFDVVAKSCKPRTAATCVRDLNINFRSLVYM